MDQMMTDHPTYDPTKPDPYFTCQCVFENDKIKNQPVFNHRVPIDCRDEPYWRRGWEVATELQTGWNDTDALIRRYGELIEHDATEEHRYEDWCRWRR